MNYIVVTQEWLAARNILPLPTMRKSKDGTKYLAHEDFFNAFKTKNADDEEVLEGLTLYPHNSTELTELLASDEWSGEYASTESADYIQVVSTRNLMETVKRNMQGYSLTGEEVNAVTDMLPDWGTLIGVPLPFKFKLQYEGKPYRVAQAHTPQSDWNPKETKALYNLISEHNGTLDDPIPYERWLVLDKGMYYTENGEVYLCTVSAENGYDADLSLLLALVEKVEVNG